MTIIQSTLPQIPRCAPEATSSFELATARLLPWPGESLARVELALLAAKEKGSGGFTELEDRLSPFLSISARSPPLGNRSATEQMIVADLAPTIGGAAFNSGPTLSALLLEIQKRLLPAQAHFRMFPLRSERDDNGRSVEFPPPETISGGFDDIAAAIRPLIGVSPAFAAAAAMIAVTSLHPFLDGNGRASRVLFNGLLLSTGITQSYLPLYEVGLLSDGGWLLALRRAQRGDWERLMQYLCTAAKICADIQQHPG